MAPDGARGVAQSTARSSAEFEAERFRKESVVQFNDARSSCGSER